MKKHFKELENEWVSFVSEAIAGRAYSGKENKTADVFLSELEKIGTECFRDGAGNIVGIIRGEGTGPNILLTGHMDVVPEGNSDAWGDLDPFKAEVREGNLYGRGISDMLGGLSACLFAFKEVKKAVDKGAKLPGDLIFAGVVMEEPAESLGTLYLMEKTFAEHGISVDLCYLAEPSDGNLAIGQRGKVELVVEMEGKVAHSSAPEQGVNAVEKSLKLIDAIFNNFGEEQRENEIGKECMTITDIVVKPGKMYSCVPDYCEITIDRRMVPPTTIEDTVNQVQKYIEKLREVDPDIKGKCYPRTNVRECYTGYKGEVAKQHPGWVTKKDNEYVKLSYDVLKELGQTPEYKYWVFGTDGSVICGKYGIPTIGYSGAEECQAHQPREHVKVDKMLECIEGYTAILFKIYDLEF